MPQALPPSAPKPIQTPAPYVTPSAVAFEQAGEAITASVASPLPIGEVSYRAARPAALDSVLEPGRALAIVAQQPGRLSLTLEAGGTIDLPVEPGLTVLPFAVAGISAGAPDFAPALTLLD